MMWCLQAVSQVWCGSPPIIQFIINFEFKVDSGMRVYIIMKAIFSMPVALFSLISVVSCGGGSSGQ
jgi:hypothetical protein